MIRVYVYIDGFNLYHALHELRENHLKWLDLWSLSEKLIGDDEQIYRVYYFTAYAKWIEESYRRHEKYIKALQTQGVTPVVGRFKEKNVRCGGTCRERYITHEEKETDVNIAAYLVADTLEDRFDRALIISADTDLGGAVRVARERAPHKKVHIVAPPGRMSRNRDLPPLFEITKGKIRNSLLPATLTTVDNELITIPDPYRPR